MTTTKLTLHRGDDYVAIMQPDETTDTALVLVRHPSDAEVRILTAMAAGGDMLAALREIDTNGVLYAWANEKGISHDQWVRRGLVIDKTRAAIAKAEGAS